jgi:hypothetical protein
MITLIYCVGVFFCTGKNMGVKITHFGFEMVFQTIKRTIIYPDSCPFLKIIVIRPVI